MATPLDMLRPIEEIEKECSDMFQTARTSLILTYPFFGILAAKLKPVPNYTWCKTLATDGKNLYYNPLYILGYEKTLKPEKLPELKKEIVDAFPDISDDQLQAIFKGLSVKNTIFAICHEILHCAFDHFSRKGMRKHNKFNRAADYAINQIIIREKIGEIHSTWLYDSSFDYKYAEEIYNLLDDGKEKSGDGEGGGPGSSLDHHHGDPNQTDEEHESRLSDFKSSMIGAAKASGAPAEIRRMISDITEPKIDWKSKLNRSMRSNLTHDVSYLRPSRRSWSRGSFLNIPIFPGAVPEDTIDICVALDASGSISEEMLRDFLGEVVGITKQFKQFKIRILTFDTSVYEVHDYVTGQEKKILEYPVKGGGGTDFMAVWEHMKADNYKPKQLIMFTDGYPFGSWGDPTYCKTLFIIHSNPNTPAPWGDYAHYEKECKKK